MDVEINRSDLHSDISPSSSPDSQHNLKSEHRRDFEYVTHLQAQASPKGDVNEEEDQIEFQLFANVDAHDSAPILNKIRLRSPTPITTEPGFVQPDRNPTHYFASHSVDQDRQFRAAAVSAAQIIQMSESPRPGCAYPWKVMHRAPSCVTLAARRSSSPPRATPGPKPMILTRKRPGKQSRIKSRTKLKAARSMLEEANQAAELKESSERAKKTERNRVKKLKRRARDKTKKAGVESDG